MDKDNRTMRQDIFGRYEEIVNKKRLTTKDICDLTGISRNTLTRNTFISDRPLYLNLFIKLCLGLEILPSELLDRPHENKDTTPENILNRLDDHQTRAVLIHALSYLEDNV